MSMLGFKYISTVVTRDKFKCTEHVERMDSCSRVKRVRASLKVEGAVDRGGSKKI